MNKKSTKTIDKKNNKNIDLKDSKNGIENVILQVEKDYGKGYLFTCDSLPKDLGNNRLLKTDVFSLDSILGGGFPFGKIVEIFGP